MSSATDIFTLTVINTNDAPTVANAIADHSTNEDAFYSFTFDSNTFNDVDFGDTLTYTATLDNDTQLPDWIVFDSSTRTFTGTPINENVGSIQIKVTATDKSLASTMDTFTLTIENTNDAPTVANAIPNQGIYANADYEFTFDVNTFNDVDTGDALTYEAMQSDNSNLPSWLSFDSATRTFSGTPLNAGMFEIKVIATDQSLARISDTFSLNVNSVGDTPILANPINDQVTNEDALYAFTFDLNTFDDVDSVALLSYTATQSDNSGLPAWLCFDASSRTFTGTPLNDDVGTYEIKITASNLAMSSATDVFTITVVNTNDAPAFTSSIENQTIPEDSDALVLTIAVHDVDTDISSLTLNCISTNQKLIQNENIIVQGTGTSRTITIHPEPDVSGKSNIELSLSDSALTSTTSFVLNVHEINDLPSISMQFDAQTFENTSVSINLTVSDIETSSAELFVTASSSNQMLVADEGIQFDRSQEPIMMTITPMADVTGVLTITVLVFDGTDWVQSLLNLNILARNHPPQISDISDQKTFESLTIGPIDFTITDADADTLTLAVYSSNAVLIPVNQIWINDTPLTSGSIQLMPSTETQVRLIMNPISKMTGTTNILLKLIDTWGESVTEEFNVWIEKPSITATAFGNGQIEPSGTIEFQTHTSSFTYIIKPNSGYVVNEVFVDHEYVGNMPQYTFYNIADFHSITASFRQPTQYTISTLASTGGTIEPGDTLVNQYHDQRFTIKSQTGYVLSQVKIDNIPIKITTSYTFENVQDHHNIEAIFTPVPKPQPDFSLNPNQGNIPLTVEFIDNTQNSVTEWLWDFGDGTQSTAQNPKHTFFEAGNYSVRLTTTGPGGTASIVKTDCIEVNNIHVDFSASPTNGLYPLTVAFTSEINASITRMTWDFGDGYHSQLANPIHTYTQVGIYSVSLVVHATTKDIPVNRQDYIQVSGRTITGQITGEDSGNPLENYTVELWQQNESLMAYTTSDQNGNYTFSSLPLRDNLVIGVWPPLENSDYHKQIYHEKDQWQNADLLSTYAHDLTNINFVLEKTSSLGLTGKVHDGTTGLPNVQVDAFSETANYHSSILTNENGDYTFTGLKAANDYKVSVWSSEYMADFYYVLPQGETPGESIPMYSVIQENKATGLTPEDPFLSNIDVILDPNAIYGGRISGHVYLFDGTPISNIVVNAWSYTLNEGYYATTDESGVYTIQGLKNTIDNEADVRSYVVSVSSGQLMGISYPYQAYNGVNDRTLATYVKTGATRVDFYLESGSNISGKITNIYGQAVPDIDIVAWSKTTGQRAETITDASGEYRFLNLKTSIDYIVAAFPLYYPIQYYNSQTDKDLATPIDLTDGDVVNINFQLNEGHMIQGNVYINDITQAAPDGIWVNIWSQITMTGGDVSTDSKGHFELTGLDPNADDYIVSIHKSGFMPTWYNDNHDDDISNDSSYSMETITGVSPQTVVSSQPVNLILKTGLSIQGKIIYNGVPQAGIQVEAWSEQSGVYGSNTSQAKFTDNANYRITGLAPGNYDVSLKTNLYKDQTLNVVVTNSDIRFIDFVLQKPEHLITGSIQGLEKDIEIFVNASADSINFNQTIKLCGSGLDTPYTLADLKPANDYIVELFHPNQYLVYNNKTRTADADKVNVYGLTSDINFTIVPGDRSISGNITFPESAQPGEIAWIESFSEKTGSLGSTTVTFTGDQIVPYQINGLQKTDDFILFSWTDRYPTQFYNMKQDREHADFINTMDAIPDNAIDFELSPGASISGKISANGQPYAGAKVSAFSTQTDSWGSTKTLSDGTYLIEGIDTADDYIIEAARSSDSAPFYYNTISTTRERAFASMVSTVDERHRTGIDLEINDFEIIGGLVKDQKSKPLSGIWISVWSEIQQSGFGTFTKEDGSFLIEDLPKSSDYQITAEADEALPYISQTKTSISSNNSSIVFTLYSGWTLSGKILDTHENAINAAEIELKSISKQINRWIITQSDGTFTIKGLANAKDYILSVISPDSSSYVSYNEYSLAIESNLSKTIILQTGESIKGHVYQENGSTLLSNIIITAFSSSQNAMGQASSDNNGFYEIKNLPHASDYVLTALIEGYVREKENNISTGTTKDFILQPGGKINGTIRTESGDPLSNVHVEVVSQSLQIRSATTSKENGSFAVQGLKKYLSNGNVANDYFVSIYPLGYVSQTQGPMRVEEVANFICVKGVENEISGTILDHNGQALTHDFTVIIKAYKNVESGGYVTKAQADVDGKFTIDGLSPELSYNLRVFAYKNGVLVYDQWSGVDDIGVELRSEAKEYRTLANVLFRFGELD
jgi:PKD repeat protein